MSHLNPGLISAYNSLTDKHLAGYFSNTRIRRHLQRAGLITRSGRIVPDKEYRHKLIQRAHQRHVRECLAQAIFQKVLEMERLHQVEIKRKLEEFSRREKVHKLKVERSKRYEEELVRILSPRPPTGARNFRKQHSGAEGEHSESSESPSSSRPNTAPGKMQRPVRLKPIYSNRRSSPYRLLESGNLQPFNCTMDKESRRRLTAVEPSHGISPYCLPVINNFVTPVPPTTKRKERGAKVTGSSTIRGRRLRPTTASSGADVSEDPPMLRSSIHQSKVSVNMVYFGKSVHLSHDLTDMKDDVKVFQQHCGGENLCVFKGKLREGEMFQFISRRHRGFPFSLTFFLNGLQVERLSSCCEFKHRRGSRLGGRHGHFGFSRVEGASPCYKCIIAIGLDKKPTPPPRRVKETRRRGESETSPKDTPEMERDGGREGVASHSECETSLPQDMETQVEEERAHEEDKVRDDYEEDFEADDEGPAEDIEAQEKNSPSPASEAEKLDKQRDATESEEDMKSRSGSSSSGSNEEESDDEATRGSKEEEKSLQLEEVKQEENVSPSVEADESKPEVAAAPKGEPAVAKDSDLQDNAGDSTEIEISDTSIPSGKEKKSSDEDGEKKIDESKQEEEQERSKSVQEKLADAILKESQCSSEPELSDTSTEESIDERPKEGNKDIVTEMLLTVTENPETLVEETKCEQSVTGDNESTQEQEESFETPEQKDESEQGPQENNDTTKDEKVEEIEEEATTRSDSLEKAEETLNLVDEENVTQDDKIVDHLEEEEAEKLNNAEAPETDEGKEEKAAVDTDVQHDEIGQGAKSREEDESSVSEPNERSDETAVPDTAEAEATTASKTMEIKAESSEEREAVSCEDAPVNDTEVTQQEGNEDRTATSETEVTTEKSNNAGDTEKITEAIKEGTSDEENVDGKEVSISDAAGIDASEKNTKEDESENVSIKDEENKDVIKEEEGEEEEISASKQIEECEIGEKNIEKSVEIVDKVEEIKSEVEGKEEDKDTDIGQIAKEENNEKFINGEHGTDNEDVEKVKKEEKIKVGGENSITEAKDEVKKTIHLEGEVMKEDKVEASRKIEEDDKSVSHENKDEMDESQAKAAVRSDAAQGNSDTNKVVEEKDDKKLEEDENESRIEQKEAKDYETTEICEVERETTDETVGGGEITEITDDAEKDIEANEQSINNTTEGEKGKMETERESNRSEEGEIDAENGEISTATETKNHEIKKDCQIEGKDELKVAEKGEEEGKPEESTEDHEPDVKESQMQSEDDVENQEDEVDQPPGGDVRGEDDQERDDGMEKQKESTKEDSQPETVGTEMTQNLKLDGSEGGETGKKSDIINENEDSDWIENNNNIQSDITEVSIASSMDQQSQPINNKNKESTNNVEMEKNALTDENAIGVDLSTADGNNRADTEEASKASEEGASVLLKPQAQSEEIEEAGPSIIIVKGPPEALAVADNKDLVSNWVNMHQSSKFFETFVEPLEDLQEISDAQDETSFPVKSEIPVRKSEDKEEASQAKAECETTDETKVEDLESEMESIHAGEKPYENVSVKDTQQIEAKTRMEEILTEAQIEKCDGESINMQEGSKRSFEEDKTKDGPTNEVNEENVLSKTEVESISGTQYSLASGKPGSVVEVQVDEKTTTFGASLTATKEIQNILPFSEAEDRQSSKSSDRVKDTEETLERTGEDQSREADKITEITTSKSDDESQEESPGGEVQPKVSEGTVDRRELIQDIKHTLSKDRLSTFSVDETLFGRSSMSLLTTARTESGH